MSKIRKLKRGSDDISDILKDILITELGSAGVPQQTIRSIVGCDMGRVSRIVKHLKIQKIN